MRKPATNGLSLAVLALAILTGTGCTAERVAQKEDMLATAGFTQRPADSPARLDALRNLPPHRFVRQTVDSQVSYLYADPTVCRCLYVGGQQAYGRYRQNVFEQRIADERLMTAQLNQDMAWDWGPWGGRGWWY